jgi:hypothetical protein
MKTHINHKTSLLYLTGIGICYLGLTTSAEAALIINEVDYDQPGSDTAEFIELYNSGFASIDLNGYTLDLINGIDGSAYNSFDLGGYNITAGGYLVLCDNTATVMNCSIDVGSSGWLQNGGADGDAIALYNASLLIDSIAYKYNNTSTLGMFAEGGSGAGIDPSSEIGSLARLPNGIDTNLNSNDFGTGCITPGTANIAGTGDCSSLSAVPIPAAVWLFGSGLLGLIGVARRS